MIKNDAFLKSKHNDLGNLVWKKRSYIQSRYLQPFSEKK